MASAGLTPLAILQAATTVPAQFFGRGTIAGQVAVGHRADLVILERDPVLDHQALHDIRAVVRGGELWSRADLDATLDRLAAVPSARWPASLASRRADPMRAGLVRGGVFVDVPGQVR